MLPGLLRQWVHPVQRGAQAAPNASPVRRKIAVNGLSYVARLKHLTTAALDAKDAATQKAKSTELEGVARWQPMESAPKDGAAILLLSIPYEMDAGPNGTYEIPAKVAIGHWDADGISWVSEGRPHPNADIYLSKTGAWLSSGGWFQPDEV